MIRFLALDADARGLSLAVGRFRGTTVDLESTLAITDDSASLTLANAAELGAKLKELLKTAGVRPAPLLVCIGRDRVILKEIRHPPTPLAEEPMVVRFQAIKDLTESPDDVVMDYIPMPSPDPTAERRALVLFVRKDVYQAAKTLADAAGLKLAGLTPRSLAAPAALANAFATGAATPLENPQSPVAVVALWEKGGEFTVVRGSEVAFTRSLSAAASTNEQALAIELKRNLSLFAGQNQNAPVRAIYFAEGDSPTAGWAGRLYDTLPVPVYPFDPIAGAPGAEAIPALIHGRFLGPVGLLVLRAAGPLPINFVAPRQPREKTGPNRNRVLIGALVGALFLALAAGIGLLEVDKANRKVAESTARRDALDEELKKYELDSKRLAAADEFSNRQIVWLDELYDLSDRVPDVSKATVTELDGSALIQAKVSTRPTAAQAAQAKDNKPVAVSNMRVTLRSSSEQVPQKIFDAFKSDKYYVNSTKTVGGTGGTGTEAKGQVYVIASHILHRGPADYARKLNVERPLPPPVPATPGGNPNELPFDEGDLP